MPCRRLVLHAPLYTNIVYRKPGPFRGNLDKNAKNWLEQGALAIFWRFLTPGNKWCFDWSWLQTIYPIPIFDILFPFPVTQSQSQWLKSHFPRAKPANPSSHFTPSGPSFVYVIVKPTVTPRSDKSSFLHRSPFLQTFFCNLQNQLSSRAIGLRDSQWGKATKLDRFQDVFAFSLSMEQCRSISVDRSQTTSWSDPGWIDPRSISKKCERSHSARIKAWSIWDQSSPTLGTRGFFSRATRSWSRRPEANTSSGHFLILDRNRKPRMKSLWNPG